MTGNHWGFEGIRCFESFQETAKGNSSIFEEWDCIIQHMLNRGYWRVCLKTVDGHRVWSFIPLAAFSLCFLCFKRSWSRECKVLQRVLFLKECCRAWNRLLLAWWWTQSDKTLSSQCDFCCNIHTGNCRETLKVALHCLSCVEQNQYWESDCKYLLHYKHHSQMEFACLVVRERRVLEVSNLLVVTLSTFFGVLWEIVMVLMRLLYSGSGDWSW